MPHQFAVLLSFVRQPFIVPVLSVWSHDMIDKAKVLGDPIACPMRNYRKVFKQRFNEIFQNGGSRQWRLTWVRIKFWSHWLDTALSSFVSKGLLAELKCEVLKDFNVSKHHCWQRLEIGVNRDPNRCGLYKNTAWCRIHAFNPELFRNLQLGSRFGYSLEDFTNTLTWS